MPIRDKAVMRLARSLTGGLSFNSIDQTAKVGPLGDRRTISMDEYNATYDSAYVDMIESVDWDRIFHEAGARHVALKHEDDPAWNHYTGICPDCLNEAMLAPNWQNWTQESAAPRHKEPRS